MTYEEGKMIKKYIVRLTEEERAELEGIVRKLKGNSERVKRAQILLKADADGPNWTDARIAESFGCRTRTIEKLRERLVRQGFEAALERKPRKTPPVPKKLDGKQEAQIIAMRLGPPPKGFSNWSLRLLADEVVALEIVDSISHETLRQMLKKTK
jgi:transposase